MKLIINEIFASTVNQRGLSRSEFWLYTLELRHSTDISVYNPIKLSLRHTIDIPKLIYEADTL